MVSACPDGCSFFIMLSQVYNCRRSLFDVVSANYGELFTDGFTIDELNASISDKSKHFQVRNLIIPVKGINSTPFFGGNGFGQITINPSAQPVSTPEKYRFKVLNNTELDKMLEQSALSELDKTTIKSMVNSKHWSSKELTDKLRADIPDYNKLDDLWSKIELQKVSLTSVGIALGHASVSRAYPEFKAPLSIWIK